MGLGGLALFNEWRSDLEARVRGGDLHPAMESHLAKYRKLVPGLALILHLSSSGTGSVLERATLQALAWAEYLETHARRAYASISVAEGTAAKAIIERIRKGAFPGLSLAGRYGAQDGRCYPTAIRWQARSVSLWIWAGCRYRGAKPAGDRAPSTRPTREDCNDGLP